MAIDAVRDIRIPRSDPHQRKVLAVGSADFFLELAASGIELDGYAARGTRATELSRTLAPDVVLLDADGCGEDPFELTSRITAAAPGVHVVVLASSADPDQVERALESGAAGYLAKGRAVRAVLAPLLPAA